MKAMRQNDRWRWLTAGAVAVCLLAFTLLIGLLAWQGVRAFWPQGVDLYTFSQPEGGETRLLGETLEHQRRFPAPADEQGNNGGQVHRYLIKTGNRDWDAPDFRVVYSRAAAKVSQPPDVMVLQRHSHGQAYGWFVGLREDNEELTAQDPDGDDAGDLGVKIFGPVHGGVFVAYVLLTLAFTVVAGTLQAAGLIRYSRGTLHVLDRGGLEAASCECASMCLFCSQGQAPGVAGFRPRRLGCCGPM